MIILSGFTEELKTRIAIIPFTAINISESNARTITGLFETALVKTNIYTIIEQSHIEEILESQKISLSGFTDNKYEIELGKLLSAEQIFLGELSIIENEYVLNIKIVDITTGRNVNSENIKTDSLSLITKNIEQIAYKIAGLPYNSVDSTKITHKKNTKRLGFTLGTGLGYLNGQFREIVYPDTSSVNPYLSELLWNLDNIYLLNLTVGSQWRSWTLSVSASTSIITETGKMTDTDWLDSSSTDRTHWSISKIWLDNSFLLKTEITYNLNLSSHISLPISIGYKLNFWDWEDKVLDYIYPDPQPADFIGKPGIAYKVIQNIFYASSGIVFTKKNITTGIELDISPYIYTWDLDHHILRDLYFLDSFNANFWYRTELTLNIKTGLHGGFLVTTFLEELPETVGDTFQYDESVSNSEELGTQTGYYADGAGLASFMWGLGISYTWTF